MGLLGELKKYVKDAMPGGLLNPEVTSQGILDGAALSTTAVPVLGDLLGLGADLHRYKNEPESRTLGNFALSGLGMLPFVPAMTAWHGSPHKFDKFSLDKIGTGEGAQAYGHGLYLAEDPAVGAAYRRQLSGTTKRPDVEYRGQDYLSGQLRGTEAEAVSTIADALAKDIPVQDAIAAAERIAKARFARDVKNVRSAGMGPDDFLQSPEEYKALLRQIKATDPSSIKRLGDPRDPGNLYKTDIPDEAVARFLDWDKPLSQQAPEVQAAIKSSPIGNRPDLMDRTGSDVHDLLMFDAQDKVAAKTGKVRNGSQQNAVSDYLAQQGIPGIRYLDGGSRSAGQGSSNFVAFSPDLIRILERNGIATGEKPWASGEWSGLLGQ